MIRVAGMQALTGIDFPGRLAAVLFLQGCPWRCSYCHNPQLLPPRAPALVEWSQVQSFLWRRRGLLDGVVFSGGEPTLQPRLGAAIAAVRELGFQTALHTGGMYPARLATLLPLLDWVGLDIKALPERYFEITGISGSGDRPWRSLQQLLAAGGTFECRTTWHPRLYPEAELQRLGARLSGLGVRAWAVQECRDARWPASEWVLRDPGGLAAGFEHFELRRA